jgi:hypothetical protein
VGVGAVGAGGTFITVSSQALRDIARSITRKILIFNLD